MKTLAAAAVVVAGTGCAGLMTASWASSAGSSTHTTDHGTGSCGVATLTRDGKPYLVVLAAGGEATDVWSGPWGSGSIKATDGRTVKWTCTTRDGVTGNLVVGGQKFRLEDGAVIFINVRDGGTVVEQVAVNMHLFEGGPVEERLKAIATSDERVARLLKECDLPEWFVR